MADPVRTEEELVVVGAGPAGMAAALAAHRLGVPVTVVDESPRPGGQVFRQPLTADVKAAEGPGHRLVHAFGSAAIRHLPGTVCWGAWPGRRLLVSGHDTGTMDVRAGAVVLATGAYERPVPFPGWTLPGVMTAGGAQVFLKSQGVRPGERFLLAGSGPLQFALAAQLVRAGARVEAVVDATRPSLEAFRRMPGLAGNPAALREGGGLARTLLRARVPVIWGAGMRRIHGSTHVEGAEITGVDGEWAPTGRGRRSFTVDTVCLGYGFVPSVELASLLGCELGYEPYAGGWVPSTDETTATSQERVYAVGDGSGLGGSVVAEREGEVAGTVAALALGYARRDPSVAARLRRLQSSLRRLRRFSRALGWVMTPKPGVADWVTDDTVICRCEEVGASEIRAAVEQGATSVRGVKLRTRAGMGPCQGRMCAPAVATTFRGRVGDDPPRPRLPVKPVDARVLL